MLEDIRAYFIENKIVFDAYDTMSKVKETIADMDEEFTIQKMIGILLAKLELENNFVNVSILAEVLGIATVHNICDMNQTYGGLIITKDVYAGEKHNKLPVIKKPRNVTSSVDSKTLGKRSLFLGYKCIDVINISNKVALSLDTNMLDYEEKPNFIINTREQMNNFISYVIGSRRAYSYVMERGNRFYFNYNYDKRGRIYSDGYFINIQSTEYKKSLINLYKKEIITC